jgi:hypothetical protein
MLCAGLVAVPAAIAFGTVIGVAAGPVARTTTAAVPPLILRIVEVVAEHTGVPARAIMARKGGPEVHAANRKALFLALSLSRRPSEEIGRYLGIEAKWQPYVLMKKAAQEVSEDPMGAETVLELAGRVHKDAPAMLLGDIPAYDLEAGYRA